MDSLEPYNLEIKCVLKNALIGGISPHFIEEIPKGIKIASTGYPTGEQSNAFDQGWCPVYMHSSQRTCLGYGPKPEEKSWHACRILQESVKKNIVR